MNDYDYDYDYSPFKKLDYDYDYDYDLFFLRRLQIRLLIDYVIAKVNVKLILQSLLKYLNWNK